MSTVWWDPLRNAITLREAVDNLFQDSLVRPRARREPSADQPALIPVDIYETKEELVLVAALPGVPLEDVDIRVDDNVMTIAATVKSEADSDQATTYTWYRHEIGHGRFSRSLSLPDSYDPGTAKAHLENGLLTIRVAKREESKPRKIAISSEPALAPGKE